MKQFKKGDKVKRVKGYHEGVYAGDTAVVLSQASPNHLFLEGYQLSHDPSNFELVEIQEEKKMLKMNWTISVNDNNWVVYNNVLELLGYEIYDRRDKTNGWECVVSSDYKEGLCCAGDKEKGKQHFENIEAFLLWFYAKEETEQQKRIRELKETIELAQKQINELENKA